MNLERSARASALVVESLRLRAGDSDLLFGSADRSGPAARPAQFQIVRLRSDVKSRSTLVSGFKTRTWFKVMLTRMGGCAHVIEHNFLSAVKECSRVL